MRSSSFLILATALLPSAFARILSEVGTLYSGPNANGYKQWAKIDGRCRRLNPRLAENVGSLYIGEGASCDLFEDTRCEKYVYEVKPTGEDNLFDSGVGYISNSVRCDYFKDVYRVQDF
ncbi:hypothetical protein BDV27DRAFT_156093 [Aspergillus caelatus]|uniref:Beta/gamma crystallin 'Greek key' domain-containing protein n=1 Tax=Aspergillus caelatus TaxID=61420 RepID=A0A5N7A934_9EURO|nr:uncharacterized protein BDV27DRAFT_156093 [Aspergillus caelatus]KAE8366235.1 hypothetical protein BDV27DRAFT_156093 [Aspergillus caelatus]